MLFKSIDLFQLHGLPSVEGADADRMHAAALTKVRQVTEEILGVHYTDGDLHLIELKGDAATPFQGHVIPTGDMFWLLFQLLGTGHIQQGKRSEDIETGTYGGMVCREGRQLDIRLDKGKQWILLYGIKGDLFERFVCKYSSDQAVGEDKDIQDFVMCPIPAKGRVSLEELQNHTPCNYETPLFMAYWGARLQQLYMQDVQRQITNIRQSSLVLVYQGAIQYISEHYMDEGLSRFVIAEALNVSDRTLSRAFEGRNLTMKSAIQIIRLHKARELLRDTDNSIEEIAFAMHFTNAKHFSAQYRKLFHQAPRQERKLWPLLRMEDEES